MNILVTNDDGVFAPGIKYLVQELENAGYSVVVFAPHKECSGKSHSITLKEKIIVKEEAIEGLNSAKGFIKKEISSEVKLRQMPELIFILDETLDINQKMEELIEEVKHGNDKIS